MEKKTIKGLFVNGGPRNFLQDLKNAYELGKRLVAKCRND